MLFTEWNMKDALSVRYEEGMEDGVAIGEARGVAIGMEKGMEKVFALMDKGYSSAEIKKVLAKKQ
jgi:flagellar biosynthesis/type III secretory pathway protein FliH